MEIYEDIEQGTESWHLLRLGSIGGSSVNSVLAKGQGKSRKTLMYKLAGEILSGQKSDDFQSPAMARGTMLESEARDYYAFQNDVEVQQVALIKSDRPRIHVSPDGLIGDDGGIEIKCQTPHVYVEQVDTGKIDLKYIRQCQHFLWVSERKWIDYVAYTPEITTRPMWVKRIERDKKIIEAIATETAKFVEELDALVMRLAR